jgi:hypothetical protein
MTAAKLPLLDAGTAAFIEGGVSINISSRDANKTPSMARAVGCRVSPDRKSVTILIPKSRAPELLDSISFCHQIAVVFSEPSTHRTIQLKGTDATIVPIERSDARLNERFADAFVAEVCPLGYEEEVIRALVSCDVEDLSAVKFTPSLAFQQTPGPRAGEPLKS